MFPISTHNDDRLFPDSFKTFLRAVERRSSFHSLERVQKIVLGRSPSLVVVVVKGVLGTVTSVVADVWLEEGAEFSGPFHRDE